MLRMSLKERFFYYSNILVIVTMTVMTLLWVRHERTTKLESIEQRGRSIVGVMAIPITAALVNEKNGVTAGPCSIDDFVTEARVGNQDLVRYIAVCTPNGTVSHADRSRLLVSRFPNDATWESLGGGFARRLVTAEDGERTLEIWGELATSDRDLGHLVVGFSLRSIAVHIRTVTRDALAVTLLLIVANSAITAVYVRWLFRPVIELNNIMKRAALDDLDVRASERPGDEVGELACSFNTMMDQLAEARDRDRVRRAQLIHTEKMVAMGTLAAGIAHEVNNPLAGILGCIENLRNNPDDQEMAGRYLILIQDGLERIQRTVSNLLDFSRTREMVLEPTTLNQNIRQVVELIAYQLKAAGVEVVEDLADDDEVWVRADHFQMEQLFLNLILNAIKAMPDGGRVTLTTRHQKGTVTAEVADTGIGIPDEIRNKIFNPFFTTQPVGEGTGLGLTVAASIVAAHAGEIEVRSAPGHGTVFKVSFKATKDERRGAGDDV